MSLIRVDITKKCDIIDAYKHLTKFEETIMTLKTENLISLINDDIVTVVCVFPNGDRKYTYKCPVDLAATLVEGDKALVQSSRPNKSYDVVEVVEIHTENLVDPEADFVYCWLFQRVASEDLTSLISKEERKLADLRKLKRKPLVKQAKDALLNLEDSTTKLTFE